MLIERPRKIARVPRFIRLTSEQTGPIYRIGYDGLVRIRTETGETIIPPETIK